MTIKYQEDEILNIEKWNYNRPFIGYLNPYGQLLNYCQLVGEYGHDNWRNPATPIFLSFISFVIKNKKIKQLEEAQWDKDRSLFLKNKYEGFDDIVKRGLSYGQDINYHSYDDFLKALNKVLQEEKKSEKIHIKYCETYWDKDPWDKLRYDLAHFFEKCYSNKDFFRSLGRIIAVENRYDICQKYNKKDSWKQHEFYYEYCLIQLMSYFKDIAVQYLGYDSIERAIAEYDLVQINNIQSASNGYTFASNPRLITTSCPNPNERFYNWLLMDWQIQRIPRMLWNEEDQRFIEENTITKYYQTEKEEILGKEIESIKKQVPKEYRKQYFRK